MKLYVMFAGSSQSPIDFDLSVMETDTPKLSHLCKNRPKPRKTHTALKPNVVALPLTSVVQPDVGFVAFFNEGAVPDSTSTSRSTESKTVVTRYVLQFCSVFVHTKQL